MARKITMFELHFDGVHFGPTGGDSPVEDETDELSFESPEDHGAGSSPVRPALAAVGAIAAVSAVGYLASRRFRGGDDEYEFDESDYVEFDESEQADEPVVE